MKEQCALRLSWSLHLQVKEILYAFEVLRDRSSAERSEQMQDSEPDWQLLTTPTLQQRSSAVEATATLLKDLLPSKRKGHQILSESAVCTLLLRVTNNNTSLMAVACLKHLAPD